MARTDDTQEAVAQLANAQGAEDPQTAIEHFRSSLHELVRMLPKLRTVIDHIDALEQRTQRQVVDEVSRALTTLSPRDDVERHATDLVPAAPPSQLIEPGDAVVSDGEQTP